MFGPVSSIGNDAASRLPATIALAQGLATNSPTDSSLPTSAGTGVLGGGGVQELSQTVQTGIQALLQPAQGSDQDDKVLQALVALLLLIVMLAAADKNQASNGQMLDNLSRTLSGSSGGGSTTHLQLSYYSESTTYARFTAPAGQTAVLTDPGAETTRGLQLDIGA